MSTLAESILAARDAELARAARALLAAPVLRAGGEHADAFVLVRRHAGTLREWFDRNTGWRLQVDAELARLVKTTSNHDPTHPARDPRSKAPFTRRRYVLAALALAALERADAQVTLGGLASSVVLAAADPELAAAGVTFTLERRDERADLVAVVRLLLGLGVLARVAGDEESFLGASGDALYDVDRRVLAALIAAPRGPSTIEATEFAERLGALTEEPPAPTDELRNQQVRRRLTARLLDDPVLYYDDLDEAERSYLTGQRHAITARITELTGLVAESRAEGLAMIDPQDELADVRMPESGTEGHATLLVAEYLAARAGGAVPIAALHVQVRAMAQAHRAYWRSDATTPGAEIELTTVAVARLLALGLVRTAEGTVTARPALARYAVAEPTISGAPA